MPRTRSSGAPFPFHVPSEAMGRCFGVSKLYERGLRLSRQDCRVVRVHGYKGPLNRAAPGVAKATRFLGNLLTHVLVKVDGKYIDWTARQFDSRSPYPLVMTPRELRALWQRVERASLEKESIREREKEKE